MKPIVGCDIDGVLYPFIVAARIYFHMRGFEVDVSVDADTHWDKLQEQVPPDAWRELWGKGRKEVFDSAAAYPGSIQAMHQIEQLARVKYVTHRPRDIAHVTLNWMGKHKLNPYALMHTPGETKGQHAQDCIAFIEDRPDNAMEIATTCKHVMVFVPRRPWNVDLGEPEVPGNIKFFDDWKEVVSWVHQATRTS